MANFIEQYSNAHNPTFMFRVRMALLARALTALQEDPATPNHANRTAAAKRIITQPETFIERGCEILSSLGLTVDSSDTDLANAINSMTDLIANTFTV